MPKLDAESLRCKEMMDRLPPATPTKIEQSQEIAKLRAQNARVVEALRNLNSHASHAENLIAQREIVGTFDCFEELHEAQDETRALLAEIAKATAD